MEITMWYPIKDINEVIDEKVLYKKVETLLNTKSLLIAKKKADDFKIFENNHFIFPDSCVFIANNTVFNNQ